MEAILFFSLFKKLKNIRGVLPKLQYCRLLFRARALGDVAGLGDWEDDEPPPPATLLWSGARKKDPEDAAADVPVVVKDDVDKAKCPGDAWAKGEFIADGGDITTFELNKLSSEEKYDEDVYDAVLKHFCNLLVPCDRDRLTGSGFLGEPAPAGPLDPIPDVLPTPPLAIDDEPPAATFVDVEDVDVGPLLPLVGDTQTPFTFIIVCSSCCCCCCVKIYNRNNIWVG